jgi:hypothetical protein
VWLRRDPAAVADSFLRRWTGTYPAGIIEAFAHGIIMQPEMFWKWVNAEGDLASALETWATPHNQAAP